VTPLFAGSVILYADYLLYSASLNGGIIGKNLANSHWLRYPKLIIRQEMDVIPFSKSSSSAFFLILGCNSFGLSVVILIWLIAF
jgi:hypothetical protein